MLSLIIPDTWLTNHQAQGLRELLLKNCALIRIISLPQKVFPDANVDTCIIVLQKESDDVIRSENKVTVGILGKDAPLENLSHNIFENEFTVMQKDWSNDKRLIFNIYQKRNPLVDKVKNGCIPLGEISEMTRGINPYAKSELMGKYGKVKGAEIVEKRIWHSDRKKGTAYKKELVGGDIGRYFLNWHAGKWVKYGEWLSRRGNPKFFTLPHIVVQRIRNPKLKIRLVSTFVDPKDEYYNNSGLTNIIAAKENYSIKYILAILNSKLINWYYRQFFRDLNIKPDDLRELPIKKVNVGEQAPLINLANKMLALNKQLIQIYDKKSDERIGLEQEIKNIDATIEGLVYELYGISDDERKLIEDSLE